MTFLVRGALPSLLIVAAACSAADASPNVRARAAHDLVCAEPTIRVEREVSGTYAAIGCGKRATYRALCEGTHCTVDRVDGP